MPNATKVTEIIVEVRGGCVQAVYSVAPGVTVHLLDWDNLEGEVTPEEKREAESLARRAASMHTVF